LCDGANSTRLLLQSCFYKRLCAKYVQILSFGWLMDGFIPLGVGDLDTPAGIGRLNTMLQALFLNGVGDGVAIADFSGYGSPESVVTASVGSTYRRIDGSTGTTFYIKQTGTGNTGWVALAGPVSYPLAVSSGGLGVDASAWPAGDVLYLSSTGVIGHETLQAQNSLLVTATQTFTAPAGVTRILVTMVGGGGGGGGGYNNNNSGGGGGSGAYVINAILAVTPASNYTVTIGAAGTAGAGGNGGANTAGGDGGATSVQSDYGTLSCNGGHGAASELATGGAAGAASSITITGGPGSSSSGGAKVTYVQATLVGFAGANGPSNANGGGGAGSIFGAGANGGSSGVGGTATNYGAGGGGGSWAGTFFNGGAGGAGVVFLQW
jgi:hypothetical protein